jgi:hypothetical protein
MSTEPNTPPPNADEIAAKIKSYKANRCLTFLGYCPDFDALEDSNFLEMEWDDLIEFYLLQCGWESVEQCYEHFVFYTPYSALDAEVERLRLAAVAGGEEMQNAILAHLAAFKTENITAEMLHTHLIKCQTRGYGGLTPEY